MATSIPMGMGQMAYYGGMVSAQAMQQYPGAATYRGTLTTNPPKFKVGDEVKCVNVPGGKRGAGFKEGFTYRITSADYHAVIGGGSWCYFGAKYGSGVYEENLVLINNSSNGATNSMTKFKVGDRVGVAAGRGLEALKPYELTICHVKDGGVSVGIFAKGWLGGHNCENHCKDDDEGSGYYVSADDLELLKPRAPKKIDSKALDSVIMPQEAKDEIIAVLKQHENCARLFEEWGLSETIEYGKGMTFLFYGTPGTGKTWCANRMAKAMGTELLVITPAEIQSQEPGGANRAIQAAFKNASETGKVLLIDECDSLITERGDVGMILGSEINTLLTEIEKFEGVCILTTNRVETLDQALERRISLIIEFKEPNIEAREMLWGKLLPTKMPIGKGVNPKDLSAFVLTGGQIKNAILQSARMAMSEGSKKVELSHVESAIDRINQSKNLLGTASRYRQIRVKDGYEVAPVANKSREIEKIKV